MAKKIEWTPQPKKDWTSKKKNEVSKESIETAAYYQWLERGCPNDSSMQDWLEAEKKLTKD